MIPDKLLVNLRILGKIQKNGKITKSIDGIISLESDNSLYKNIKRYIGNAPLAIASGINADNKNLYSEYTDYFLIFKY